MPRFRVFTYDVQRKEWEVEAEDMDAAVAMFDVEEPEENIDTVVVIDEYWDGIAVEFAEEVEE